jgi:glycosyltransferase involved in cell wall biosynthesis
MTAEKGTDAVRHIGGWLSEEAIERTRVITLGGATRGPIRFGPLRGHQAGFVTEVHNAMAGLDLLWHPASEEGLGTVLIDALGLKVPPIAFDVGGVGEIIETNKNGLLIALDDTHAFASAHQRLLDPAGRQELAVAGPDRAAVFSVEAMREGVERVYQRVLSA